MRLTLFIVAISLIGLIGVRNVVDFQWGTVIFAIVAAYGLGYWTARRQARFMASAAALATAKAQAIAEARARASAQSNATQQVVVQVGTGLSSRNIETYREAIEDGYTEDSEDMDGAEMAVVSLDAQEVEDVSAYRPR